MHCFGELSGGLGGLEAEVVIAMAELWFSARVDYRDLCGELVGWSEIGLADEGEPGVRVVRDKGGGIGKSVLLEGVPDARITASCGEMVTFGGWRSTLFCDNRFENLVDCCDE